MISLFNLPSAPSQVVPKVGSSRSAFAPSTIANLGPGFDFIGAALEGQGNVVTATLLEGKEIAVVEDQCQVGSDKQWVSSGQAAPPAFEIRASAAGPVPQCISRAEWIALRAVGAAEMPVGAC